MGAHSSILAWKIPWIVESGRLPSMGQQRLGHDWVSSLSLSSYNYLSSLIKLVVSFHPFFFLYYFLFYFGNYTSISIFCWLLKKLNKFLRFNSNVNQSLYLPLNNKNLASLINEPTFTKLCNLIFFFVLFKVLRGKFLLKKWRLFSFHLSYLL